MATASQGGAELEYGESFGMVVTNIRYYPLLIALME